MTSHRFRLAATALALILVAGPAVSQTPMDDPLSARDAKRVDRMEKVVRELRGIVFQMRDTGKPVVVQPAETDARLAGIETKISDLEATLQRLNGTLETTTHELDLARRSNTELQAEVKALGDRLASAEAKLAQAAEVAAAEPAPAVAATPSASPTEAFTKARQLMLGGDYDAAESAFADFVETYPDTPRSPEARYWWGKTLTVKGDHARAASAYVSAVRGWPQTTWAPDATVELARSLVQLKKPADACTALGELSRRYPKAPASVTARAAATRTQAKCA